MKEVYSASQPVEQSDEKLSNTANHTNNLHPLLTKYIGLIVFDSNNNRNLATKLV